MKARIAKGLPATCFSRHPKTNHPILIKRGVIGYFLVDEDPEKANKRRRLTKAQYNAMLAGSQHGWDGPDADPANYDSEGKPLFISSVEDAIEVYDQLCEEIDFDLNMKRVLFDLEDADCIVIQKFIQTCRKSRMQ